MQLLRRIEIHLRRSDTPPSRFGRQALGDPGLVKDLRNGREPRPATIRRLCEYLARAESEEPRKRP
jgi:hypothetical protein